MSAGGVAFISSGGMVSGGTIVSGVAVTLAAGGIVSGGLTLAGGTAVISGSVSSSQTISFAGSGGDLALATPGGFAALISGFSAGDQIDLLGLRFSSETFTQASGGTSGTLTLSGSSGQASVTLLGGYATSSFIVSSDGAGGTFVGHV
jgi:hypothetical protein